VTATQSTDGRMTDVEAMMWRFDKDPYLASTFANVTIVDRHIDLDRLLARMERTSVAIPRLRQRVQPAPGNFGNPSWVDDPAFDIRYHVRHVSLPAPGSLRQLLDLAMLILVDPFERTRPLWQFIVVDGLEGGRGALIEKLHHSVSDGEGGVELAMNFLDLERDPAPPPPLEREESAPASAGGSDPGQVLRSAMSDSLRIPLALLRQVRDVLSDPALLGTVGPKVVDNVRGLLAQTTDIEPARSPLWTERSLRRRLEVLSAPFSELRAASRMLGGTLNTAFVAAAADAAGAYHRRLGHPVDSLRTSIAVSTREEAGVSNAFSLARLLVPTGEMPVADRFREINDRLSAARDTALTGSVATVSAIGALLPTAVVTRIAKAQSQTVDFATSNVRGAGIPLYVAGAKLLHNYPVGPIGGTAFNLTLLSYLGYLDMGVNIDPSAVHHPDLLMEELRRSFDEIVSLVPRTTPTVRPEDEPAGAQAESTDAAPNGVESDADVAPVRATVARVKRVTTRLWRRVRPPAAS